MASTREATPGGSDGTPAYRGSLSTSFSVESTDVERDMANAVKTEMQFYNSSGNPGRCESKPTTKKYLMSIRAT